VQTLDMDANASLDIDEFTAILVKLTDAERSQVKRGDLVRWRAAVDKVSLQQGLSTLKAKKDIFATPQSPIHAEPEGTKWMKEATDQLSTLADLKTVRPQSRASEQRQLRACAKNARAAPGCLPHVERCGGVRLATASRGPAAADDARAQARPARVVRRRTTLFQHPTASSNHSASAKLPLRPPPGLSSRAFVAGNRTL
jgi:hypothetical protein